MQSQLKLTPMWHGQLWVTVLLPNRYSNDGRWDLNDKFFDEANRNGRRSHRPMLEYID
jgi:hypothetical protein